MEDLGRLYIIPKFNKEGEVTKTHFARVAPCQFGTAIEKLCLPNIAIWLHNCECPAKCNGECDGTVAHQDWAESWDEFFNEVTCETCLRIARFGYKRNIQAGQLSLQEAMI